jgi:HPt (histidine-containing phosphotransfer) domain-containing protein
MIELKRPVDLAHLDRYTGGDLALDREILSLFDTQCSQMLAKLEELAPEFSDAKSWHEIAHSLKGAARGIGAFALADAAAEAEMAGSDKAAAVAALHHIKSRSCAVALFIEEFLKTCG